MVNTEPPGGGCRSFLGVSEVHMKVCSTVDEINVDVNVDGTISITQAGQFAEESSSIVVPPELVPALCKALRETAKSMADR
jgi:hypothetical protein